MALTDQLLKYKIVADAYQAKAEIKSTDDAFKNLGGSAAASLGSFAAPAGIAAAAIAGIGIAAAGVGVAIFNLTKKASDFGSILHDAGQKTGLSAEAISTLKFNAENAGSSLEAVTTGIARFVKLHPDVTNLNKALDETFKTIYAGKPGAEQIGLAIKAFGKSGADLIPLIDQMNGRFNDSIEAAKKLGITLSQEDLDAADNFGDTLGLLGTQAEITADKFLLRFAPNITSAMQSVSKEIEDSQSTLNRWVDTSEDLVTGVKRTIPTLEAMGDTFAALPSLIEIASAGLLDYTKVLRIASFGVLDFVEAQKQMYDQGLKARTRGVSMGGTLPLSGGYSPNVGGASHGMGGKSPEQLAAEEKRRAAEQKRLDEQQVHALVKSQSEALALQESRNALQLAQTKADLDKGYITQEVYAKQEVMLAGQVNQAKTGYHEAELQLRKKLGLETADIVNKQAVLENNVAKEAIDNSAKVAAAQKADLESVEEIKKRSQEVELTRLAAIGKQLYENAETAKQAAADQAAAHRQFVEATSPTASGTLLGSLQESLGAAIPSAFDPATNAMKSFQMQLGDVQADINNFTGVGLGNMIDGLAQMGAAWLSSGEFSAKAALQMISATALQIAFTAIMKEVFEYAEAAAAFARWDFVSGSAHLAAAGMYQIAATVAGGIGVGAGLGARAMGGGKKGATSGGGSSAGGSSSAGGPSNQPLTPYSRSGPDAFISGSRNGLINAIQENTQATLALHSKIDSKSAGEILTVGIKQNPNAVPQATIKGMARNAGYGKRFNQVVGIK